MYKEGDYYGVIEYSNKIASPSDDTSFIIAKSYMALVIIKKQFTIFIDQHLATLLKLITFLGVMLLCRQIGTWPLGLLKSLPNSM